MITISDIEELEIQKYAPVFYCVYNLFGSYEGIFFKLDIDGEEKILQRNEDLFVLYTVNDEESVDYEMFTVDEKYKVVDAGFDDFEMHKLGDTVTVTDRDSRVLESLTFSKRSDGVDNDGYDGIVAYVQYNQEYDVRLMIMYQQMYNSDERVYSYHVSKEPFQITIEHKVVKKQNAGRPVKMTRYIRGEYVYRDNPTLFNIATIRDYGLSAFMEQGAFALQEGDRVVRYYKVLFTTKEKQAITGFPLMKQYRLEDFDEIFVKYGFKKQIPEYLIEIHNGNYQDLNKYQEVATFMKEIEMTLADEAVTLDLKI